ncbi:hypothetical protein [Dyella sp. 333MFSha]|uniref:hypothetical protein n=1 Tax=Dyella sp. 333MFSha TaxID=1798240 RepID=UPI00088BAF6F|nr:hypothetical protein [Dyella sp. 333MFSha]SDG65513.1 hypothetical protein SAMN04515659_3251 [Dyella sp. 333MFSha]
MAKKDATSTSKEIIAVVADRAESPVAKAILEFVSRIPDSDVPRAAKGTVEDECRRLSSAAANKAGLTAGSLALPPGPLGWLTVLPELVAIWRIQGQLVSDIAAAYGKTAKLGQEQMLWCLFRHTAAQAFRDIAIRVGDRLVFRTAATSVLQRLAGRIGVSVSKRAVGKGISRWLPIVGALGVGAYAYYDTGQVAKTAMELFSGEIHIEGDDTPDGSGSKKSSRNKPKGEPAPHTSGAAGPVAASSAGETPPGPTARRAAASVGAGPAGDAPKGHSRKAATKKRATPKRATDKKSAARKATPTRVAKASTRKATKKTAARRAPAKKPAARKIKPAT